MAAYPVWRGAWAAAVTGTRRKGACGAPTTSNTHTTIASGGTRGDYVAPDTTIGSLLLTYSDIVARLSCGTGCSIGSKVPEPMSLALLAVGAMGIAFARRR